MRPPHVLFVASVAGFFVGCGPVFLPLTTRMTPEDQQQIDAMWDNMLTPASRVSRETVLDTMLANWLYENGVDRLHLVSEKYLSHGKVVMEADCDRGSPETDQFTTTVLDDRGRTVRRERYLRAEIEARAQALWDFDPNSIGGITHRETGSTEPATQPSSADQGKLEHQLQRERRLKAVQAATQPARL